MATDLKKTELSNANTSSIFLGSLGSAKKDRASTENINKFNDLLKPKSNLGNQDKKASENNSSLNKKDNNVSKDKSSEANNNTKKTESKESDNDNVNSIKDNNTKTEASSSNKVENKVDTASDSEGFKVDESQNIEVQVETEENISLDNSQTLLIDQNLSQNIFTAATNIEVDSELNDEIDLNVKPEVVSFEINDTNKNLALSNKNVSLSSLNKVSDLETIDENEVNVSEMLSNVSDEVKVLNAVVEDENENDSSETSNLFNPLAVVNYKDFTTDNSETSTLEVDTNLIDLDLKKERRAINQKLDTTEDSSEANLMAEAFAASSSENKLAIRETEISNSENTSIDLKIESKAEQNKDLNSQSNLGFAAKENDKQKVTNILTQTEDSLVIEDIKQPAGLKFTEKTAGNLAKAETQTLKPSEQIKIALQENLASQKQKFTVSLTPESLGRVEVNIELYKGEISKVSFFTERQDTLDAIIKDSQILEQAVSEILSTEDLKFSFNLKQDQDNLMGGNQNQSAEQHAASTEEYEKQYALTKRMDELSGRISDSEVDIIV